MPMAVVSLLTLATWLVATCLLRNPLRAGLFTALPDPLLLRQGNPAFRQPFADGHDRFLGSSRRDLT